MPVGAKFLGGTGSVFVYETGGRGPIRVCDGASPAFDLGQIYGDVVTIDGPCIALRAQASTSYKYPDYAVTTWLVDTRTRTAHKVNFQTSNYIPSTSGFDFADDCSTSTTPAPTAPIPPHVPLKPAFFGSPTLARSPGRNPRLTATMVFVDAPGRVTDMTVAGRPSTSYQQGGNVVRTTFPARGLKRGRVYKVSVKACLDVCVTLSRRVRLR